MKKALCLIIACMLIVGLFAGCGGEPAAPAAPADPAAPAAPADPAAPAAPADPVDDTVYTLSFASTSPEGGARNLEVEVVLKDLLYEKSNGRIILDIYSNSTLASSKEMLDALTSGIADIGQFLTPMYQGQFPYSDLYSTPGLYYGTIAETDEIIRAYTEAFPDEIFGTQLKLCCRWSLGDMALITVNEVKTVDEINGLTLRAASSGLPFYEACGAAGVSMSASDVYEGLKMGTINATVTGYSGMKNNKLAEVANYAISVPVNVGEEAICMNMAKYNSLPADIQQILDEVFAEMNQVISNFTQADQDAAIADAKQLNPNFVVNEFSEADVERMYEIGASLMEAKAAELDEMGLDGTGALQWLRDHAK